MALFRCASGGGGGSNYGCDSATIAKNDSATKTKTCSAPIRYVLFSAPSASPKDYGLLDVSTMTWVYVSRAVITVSMLFPTTPTDPKSIQYRNNWSASYALDFYFIYG